jgi:hypothetical protein
MSKGSRTVTLEIPNELHVPLGENGKATTIPLESFNEEVLKMGLVNGFVKALGDISRGKDEKGVPLSDDAWLGARQKRVDAWLKGVWAKGERGDSNMAIVKDQFFFEQMAGGASQKSIDKLIKSTIEEYLGKDEKFTFANFLTAIGKANFPEDEKAAEEHADELEKLLMERALKRKAEQDKAASKIKIPADLAGLIKLK